MNGLCKLGRISTPILKGCIPKNQLFTPKIFCVGTYNYHQSMSIRAPFKTENDARKYFKTSLPIVTITKQISTTPANFSSHKAHDHSKLWTLERGLSVALLGVIPAALCYPSQPLDTVMALLIVIHTHFGLEAIVVDYIRPILFGEMAPKIGMGVLYLFSLFVLAGLLNLIYNDCGLANTILSICKK